MLEAGDRERVVEAQSEHEPLACARVLVQLLELAVVSPGEIVRELRCVAPPLSVDRRDGADADAEVVAAEPVAEVVQRALAVAAEVRGLVPAVAAAGEDGDDALEVVLHRLRLARELVAVMDREARARLRLELVTGEMLRPERDRRGEVGLEVGDGLAGNAVDEVEREVVEAGVAQVRERAANVVRLRAALERVQQMRLERLRTERDSRDARCAKRARELGRDRLGIRLDRHLLRVRQRLDQPDELGKRRERRRAAAEEDRLDRIGEDVPLLVQLAQERIDVGGVLLRAADGGDEIAVAAPVRAERQMDVQMPDAHEALFGRATSSPPQLGQTCSICAPQSAQNVHSNEQMTASPSAASATPHRSHTVRISRLTAGPSRC